MRGCLVRAQKKKKDPNAPKKAISAYFFFCADHREKVKKEHPDLKLTEISSELGKLWKECSEVRPQRYFLTPHPRTTHQALVFSALFSALSGSAPRSQHPCQLSRESASMFTPCASAHKPAPCPSLPAVFVSLACPDSCVRSLACRFRAHVGCMHNPRVVLLLSCARAG